MRIESQAFKDGEIIPNKFTCDGSNINPELSFFEVPEGALSLALIVDDPDSVGGRTFLHWAIWNISPRRIKIEEGFSPDEAVEGKNDFGKIGYGGPCPSNGVDHHYRFRLFAIKGVLTLPPDSSGIEIENAIISKGLIEKAELIGIYKR
jgi:Raf kinase inhibitor-like YbhB/YbcL family protein